MTRGGEPQKVVWMETGDSKVKEAPTSSRRGSNGRRDSGRAESPEGRSGFGPR